MFWSVNKFYGAIAEDWIIVLGNNVINLYMSFGRQQVLWRRCRGLDNSPLVIVQ